MIDEQEKI